MLAGRFPQRTAVGQLLCSWSGRLLAAPLLASPRTHLQVLEASAIAVNRRKCRGKRDGLGVRKLLRLLGIDRHLQDIWSCIGIMIDLMPMSA